MKYIGDAILKGSLTVLSNKPLDSRLVVDTYSDLQNISDMYKYKGMPVVCADNGDIWVWTTLGWVKGTNSGGSGKSAYDLYVESLPNGQTPLTLAQWLLSLKGDSFTFEDFTEEQLNSLKGEQGPQGPQGILGIQGVKGDQGYPFMIWKQYDDISEFNDLDFPQVGLMFIVMSSTENGYPIYRYTGDTYLLLTYLNISEPIIGPQGILGPLGIQGPKGDTGPKGEQGVLGERGKSVYDIYLDTVPEGQTPMSEVEWILSLSSTIDISTLINYATKLYVDLMIELNCCHIKHVFLTLEEYNSLEIKNENTLYFIIEEQNKIWGFGDKFPVIFSDSSSNSRPNGTMDEEDIFKQFPIILD